MPSRSALAIPGAMDARLSDALFWLVLALALGIAWLAAWPVNRWLIARGRGHAVVHSRHDHGHEHHQGSQRPSAKAKYRRGR